MTIQDIRQKYLNQLSELYTTDEIDFIFFTIAEKLLHKDKSIIRAGLHESWSELNNAKLLFTSFLIDLKSGKPYQYVLGETEFMGLKLFVNNQVLIPRPETEELVEWIIENYHNRGNQFKAKILDIGTGSGAIAIALKNHFPETEVYAIDYSESALEVAKTNAKYHHLDINFSQKNILTDRLLDLPSFDIIVSNPPYIPVAEKESMQKQVSDFEPASALFVPDENPLQFYKEINLVALEKLAPYGKLFVEFHQDLKTETKEIFAMSWSQVQTKKDISGNWRMLSATQPYSCG